MITYDEAIEYLYGFIDYEKVSRYVYDAGTLNLDRMRGLLSRLGDPHRGLRCVHVAGTNGKGSSAAMIASVLRAAGYRVGLYTSPHLVTFRERIRIGGKAISRKSICLFVERLRQATDQRAEPPEAGAFTFFEVWTALAFSYFAAEHVDFAVVEVGMGGRLDATNVVEPLVAVITPIGMDHAQKLGNTAAKIAREKAGIIKEEGTVIVARQTPEVMEVIRSVCREHRARCLEVGRDVAFDGGSSSEEGQEFRVAALGGVCQELSIPLLGSHQIANAALAVGTAALLAQQGVAVSKEAVRQGLRAVRWPGRLQVVGHHPLIVLDGACNVHGAEQVRQSIQEAFAFNRLVLVLGMCNDKDVGGVYRAFEPLTDIVVLAQADNPRALSAACIAERIAPSRAEVVLGDKVAEAIERAQTLAAVDDLVLITGSLYVVGEAMIYFGLNAERI